MVSATPADNADPGEDSTGSPVTATSGTSNQSSVSASRGWLLGACILLLLAAEVWSAISVVQRTKHLNNLLSSSFTVAVRLERAIGYGGLIHNFKNYLLRPDQMQYYHAAMADAETASVLIGEIVLKVQQIGIDAQLEHTAAMIQSYRVRLNQVRELSVFPLSAREIDQRVAYDDELAVAESARLLEELIRVVEIKLAALQRNAFIVLFLIGSMVLGLLLVAWSIWNSRRYLSAIRYSNDHLSLSNRRLSVANESLQQFTTIVSHHLKTPLRHIGFHCEELLDEHPHDARLATHAGSVMDSVAEMILVTDSLLDYTQTGSQSLRLESIELATLVSEVRDDLAADIARRGAHVEVQGSLSVVADRQLLARVFANLIDNSLTYARPGTAPWIVVEADRLRSYTVISITDNGIGMATEYADAVFRPLHRLHGPNSDYPGVGMGLALVRSIIARHGGRVWFDTGYRAGSRICLELPWIEVPGPSIVSA